jgi:hypothetical protein
MKPKTLSDLDLTLYFTDSVTDLTKSTQTDIAVNSDKYSKLIKWFSNNQAGWEWAPASYLANVSIDQGPFKLLYLKGREMVL